MAVFERAAGRCERCGMPAGSVGLRDDEWRVIGAHIHHLVPISAGGGHALENLTVRCADCHSAEHPDNFSLRTGARRFPLSR
jgi:5-methylcytosine-specific restriction endonuclease McrA